MAKLDMVRIDQGQCVACAICVDVCSPAALRIGPNDLLPTLLPERCTGCAVCEQECPVAAIVVNRPPRNLSAQGFGPFLS